MNPSFVLQNFVPAKEDKQGIPNPTEKEVQINGELSGKEARAFYETVTSCSSDHFQSCSTPNAGGRKELTISLSEERSPEFCRRKSSRRRIRTTPYGKLVNDFLKFAQEGNLVELQRMVSQCSIDVNVCDQFSWTALMCSSYSGQYHVVKYLLGKEALWKNFKDSHGRTALDLARLAGHANIVELLLTGDGPKRKRKQKGEMNNGEVENKTKYWCSVCEQEFTDDRKKHQSSTIHLFNSEQKPQRTFYYIPEQNIGYQMMLNSGWIEEQGLGPAGLGRKYPVKTVLKRDRLGLGNTKSQQPRVTHFGPFDSKAVRRKQTFKEEKKTHSKGVLKKERLAKEKKQKIWERNLRVYMNTA